MNVLQLSELSTSAGKKQILREVSAGFLPGGFHLLIGPNGAGKTTLLRCLSGLFPVESGRIFWDGGEVDPFSDEWKYIIGMVPESESTIGELTVWEQMELICQLFSVPKAETNRRVEELIRLLQMDGYADELASVLSTGMRKRLAVALSLLHAPRLVLFDEPLNSLDVYISGLIIELLEFLKAAGRTIICTSHEIDLLLPLTDRIIELSGGTVVNVLDTGKDGMTREDVFNGLKTVKHRADTSAISLSWFTP